VLIAVINYENMSATVFELQS